ncbi:D-alanine--D-alanine ligase [Roseibacterium sp. SDUM158016]|uniref:D-alanine--D-alanine ligase n=1 Tax=Roseicyclus sediminis TaxID=2980997 RepID=UPI0021D29836|nr:D-alanine--D-alanine ligase [Roseibacterium sp. SDUM158016]MCU4652886.1 D-alanine--D-alanine ligase [Roseibacterium sp. SDUM158016]
MTGSSRPASRVVVLMGGPSAEREVSLSTGKGCAEALRGEGYDVIEVDAGPDLAARLADLKPDVVFNALHGRWGEDGCVQGMLEWLRIPYTHSGVLASALAMDKTRTKDVYRAHGLPVVDSVIRCKAEVMAHHVMAPPYVVKPNNEGSSVGVYLVAEGANDPPKLGAEMPEHVMVEAFVTGRELTCSVMGAGEGDPGALTVTDILTEGWYDYDAKYRPGGSRHVVPAEIPAAIFDACMDYATRAHAALGCRGVSRTDFRWDEGRGADGLILLETNTQPGMTPTSLTPEQAEAKGITFGALCRWLVEDASCDR